MCKVDFSGESFFVVAFMRPRILSGVVAVSPVAVHANDVTKAIAK